MPSLRENPELVSSATSRSPHTRTNPTSMSISDYGVAPTSPDLVPTALTGRRALALRGASCRLASRPRGRRTRAQRGPPRQTDRERVDRVRRDVRLLASVLVDHVPRWVCGRGQLPRLPSRGALRGPRADPLTGAAPRDGAPVGTFERRRLSLSSQLVSQAGGARRRSRTAFRSPSVCSAFPRRALLRLRRDARRRSRIGRDGRRRTRHAHQRRLRRHLRDCLRPRVAPAHRQQVGPRKTDRRRRPPTRVSAGQGHYPDWWQVQDSNLRRRKPTDLQSAPIGRSGNLPRRFRAGPVWPTGSKAKQ